MSLLCSRTLYKCYFLFIPWIIVIWWTNDCSGAMNSNPFDMYCCVEKVTSTCVFFPPLDIRIDVFEVTKEQKVVTFSVWICVIWNYIIYISLWLLVGDKFACTQASFTYIYHLIPLCTFKYRWEWWESASEGRISLLDVTTECSIWSCFLLSYF